MKKFVQGERAVFTILLTQKDANGVSTAFDLTGNTEITVCWQAESTTLTKNRVGATIGVVVVGLDTAGKIQGTLEVADTNAFPASSSGHLEILVDFGGGNVTKFQEKNSFQVISKICA